MEGNTKLLICVCVGMEHEISMVPWLDSVPIAAGKTRDRGVSELGEQISCHRSLSWLATASLSTFDLSCVHSVVDISAAVRPSTPFFTAKPHSSPTNTKPTK